MDNAKDINPKEAKLWTVAKVADFLGVSTNVVKNMVYRGELKAIEVSSKTNEKKKFHRFRRQDIMDFIKGQVEKAETPEVKEEQPVLAKVKNVSEAGFLKTYGLKYHSFIMNGDSHGYFMFHDPDEMSASLLQTYNQGGITNVNAKEYWLTCMELRKNMYEEKRKASGGVHNPREGNVHAGGGNNRLQGQDNGKEKSSPKTEELDLF